MCIEMVSALSTAMEMRGVIKTFQNMTAIAIIEGNFFPSSK